MDAKNPWQTLDVRTPHCCSRRLQVTDASTKTLLYNCVRKTFSRNDMTIHRGAGSSKEGSQDDVVGRVSFHCWSSSIDVEMVAKGPVQMKTPSYWSGSHRFVCEGATWTWERDGGFWSCDLRLLDEKGLLVATLERPTWSYSRVGTIKIARKLSDEMLDLVVVTGLAKLEAKMRHEAASAGGG
ncbi:hypothetical protein CDD80_2935 [Ophiocordyceps camponoti-rufipedis]|uniref:DUF6593 domain-containing protein n=1 Tax=Ophiocordyceps camponoti-rufipedis TaxID=2004952 RepID=A0A2C5Z5L0_9HYPO|nr:hypothetical protein CDD80_2935 [Ophiocordyceps camponoti-rufipedis]